MTPNTTWPPRGSNPQPARSQSVRGSRAQALADGQVANGYEADEAGHIEAGEARAVESHFGHTSYHVPIEGNAAYSRPPRKIDAKRREVETELAKIKMQHQLDAQVARHRFPSDRFPSDCLPSNCFPSNCLPSNCLPSTYPHTF